MTLRLYKAADVCETAGLQPYVLRSWEKEFPGIGVQKSPESPRLYRESDIEQVLRIKQLVFVEGLTLSGARRRLEDALPTRADGADADTKVVLDTLGADARTRIAFVRDGLRSILKVLSKDAGADPSPTRSRDEAARSETRASSKKQASRPERRAAAARPAASKEKRTATKRSATPKRAASARKAGAGKGKRVVQRF